MKRITVTLYLKNGKIKKYATTDSITRILQNVSLRDWVKCLCSVSYGMKIDTYGERVEFKNWGAYFDKKEAKEVIKDFWNEE